MTDDTKKLPQSDSSKTFAKTDIDNILLSKFTGLFYFYKNNEDNKPVYEKFNQDFGLFLSKLPNHAAKKYTSEVFNRDLVYLGSTQLAKAEGFFSKVITNDSDDLKAILLDIKDLDINIKTGETKNIDDCIYATYFSFIRAAVIANKVAIKSDYKLQDMLAQYLYLLVSSTLDSKTTLSTPKQKLFVKMICFYAFYRYFIKETYTSALRKLRKAFDEEVFVEFEPRLKDIERYDSVKDIPKMLIDTKVSIVDPNVFVVNLIKKFKQYGFYCVLGPLDMFIGFAITSKYPFELFVNGSINSELQTKLEDHMIQYMKKVKFSKL